MIDDTVVNNELNVRFELFQEAILVREALLLDLGHIDLLLEQEARPPRLLPLGLAEVLDPLLLLLLVLERQGL